jgi:hypothetical protein
MRGSAHTTHSGVVHSKHGAGYRLKVAYVRWRTVQLRTLAYGVDAMKVKIKFPSCTFDLNFYLKGMFFMKTTIKSVATAAAFVTASLVAGAGIAADPAKALVGTPDANYYTQGMIDRIDANKDGKVSKAEFMRFASAEFNYLDRDKSGMLDTKKMTHMKMYSHSRDIESGPLEIPPE